jgi:hypothetical protein
LEKELAAPLESDLEPELSQELPSDEYKKV